VFDEYVQENVVHATYEVAARYAQDPTLDGKPAAFDDYLGAKLGFKLREIDRQRRPHMYDKETGKYLGSEGEWREGLSGLFPDEDGPLDEMPRGGRKKKRKSREDVPDPTQWEAIRNIRPEAGELKPFGWYLDKVTDAFKRDLRYSVAPFYASALPGPIRLIRWTWENGGEQLSGRDAGRALWAMPKAATAPAEAAANLIGPLLEIGAIEPPPPNHRRFGFLRHH
jgi:hypothetical protein